MDFDDCIVIVVFYMFLKRIFLFFKYILFIMLLQLSQFFLPFIPFQPCTSPPFNILPHLSSCPWVVYISSLASPFPMLKEIDMIIKDIPNLINKRTRLQIVLLLSFNHFQGTENNYTNHSRK